MLKAIASGIKMLAGVGDSKTGRDLFDRKDGHLKSFGEALGNMRFTKEEMAEYDEETAKGVRQFAIDTMTENTDRSKARRELAILCFRVYLLFLFMCGITYKIDQEWSKVWWELATNPYFAGTIAGIGVFFWGTHTLRAAKGADKK